MTATQEYDWKMDLDEEDPGSEVSLTQDLQGSDAPESDLEQSQYQITAPKRLSERPMVLISLVFGGLTALIFFVVLGYTLFSKVGAAIHAEKYKTSDPATESFSPSTPFNQETGMTREQELQQKLTSKDMDASITRFNSMAEAEEPEKPEPAASTPPTPNRVVAPRVVYRDRVVTKPSPPPKPKVVYRDRPVTRPAPVRTASVPPPPPRIAPPVRSSLPQPPQDPYEQWGKLAGLGMVGGGDVATVPTVSNAPQDALFLGSSNDVVPVFDPSAFPHSESPVDPEPKGPVVNLPLGTVVKGSLMHDVGFVNGSTSTDKAVVELSEPLGDIPKGAMISTQIKSVDDNGALSMSILGYEHENVYQSMSLPEIQVTSARASSGGGNNLGRVFRDVAGIGLDVLSNETGQQINFNNGRVSSITTDTDSGFLDRSVDAVSSRLLERNRSSARTSRRSPKVKKGSTVRFTVISPLG